jgi:hypothetical protein
MPGKKIVLVANVAPLTQRRHAFRGLFAKGSGVAAAWSPDNRTVVVSLMLRGQRSGYVLDSVSLVDGGVRELLWHPGVIGRPLWLPEGDKVLIELDDPRGRGGTSS